MCSIERIGRQDFLNQRVDREIHLREVEVEGSDSFPALWRLFLQLVHVENASFAQLSCPVGASY